jgi:hypothetical protein
MSDPSSSASTSTHYLTQPQTSHLVSLHHLLSLPATSLQSDHQRIALAIRAAVDAVIRDREDEVQEWRDRIRDGIRDIAGVERATGVGRGEGRRFEIKDNEVSCSVIQTLLMIAAARAIRAVDETSRNTARAVLDATEQTTRYDEWLNKRLY